ncbi:DNA breaking-rejoining enzyme [Trametes coccinea BRFM310]|uniref:DNA breaking-rejoining enzyme n=1 Tax=Trametes coccinea (strain BRFM310) TaxID=1353009 RepID=A0A1Y2J1T5_TRAC3|nr:DNA breaking-rejoining enzyme [Trametes coccinea BRFM310]
MDKADDLDITTGKPKDLSIPRVTYARAQKMRAAVSHKFSREYKLGTQDWKENPLRPGTFSGNPSLSPLVSQYMISLRRRKVRAGEIVTSARAMDQETMRKLWEFNTSFPYKAELEQNSRKRKREQPEHWAGHKVRQMLQALYVVSMLCLLRYDEALRIMWTDINFTCIGGVPVVELRLPFRKTDQNGGIAPFWLWPCPERPWMDAVAALARWWQLCSEMGVERYGYVFRSRYLYDEVSVRADHAMSTNSFLEYFRNNMLDIGIDPRPYGTHSFRRGGCQYLAKELRWPIRTICEWGGWAENFDNPGTIFRYLLSWVDTPAAERKDLFNPNRPGQDPCTACGRTCHCS